MSTLSVNPIGSNQTEVTTAQGNTVLFSYRTAVAAHVQGKGFVRTNKFYSVTTSKHINRWLNDNGATPEKVEQVDPAFFDTL